LIPARETEIEENQEKQEADHVCNCRAERGRETTFASKFLPDFVDCREFLNADLIAAGLSPFAPETQNVRAGRLLLERIAELAEQRANFSFETTLSCRTYVKLLEDIRQSGYRARASCN